MFQIEKMRLNKDAIVVVLIGLVLVTGLALIVVSALNGSSFIAILGVSIAFWSVLLVYLTPTKNVGLNLLNASASTCGSNIERSLMEFNLTGQGVYLPPHNLQDIESSLVFVPGDPQTPLPQSNQTNDKLFTKQQNGLLFTPPGLALTAMFEHELGLSFRKIPLPEMQKAITKLIHKLDFAEDAQVRIQDRIITLEFTNSIYNELCDETRKSQPREHAQVGCILASAFACALAKATDEPITIQNDTLNTDTKTLTIEYHLLEPLPKRTESQRRNVKKQPNRPHQQTGREVASGGTEKGRVPKHVEEV